MIQFIDLNQLKNEYVAERKRLNDKGTGIARVVLHFSQPVELYYSRYRKDNQTKAVHEVKKLFFLKNGTCNCEHEPDIIPEKACYVAGRARSSGFFLSTYALTGIEIVEKTLETSDYSRDWENIAISCQKYGINLDVAEAIEKHLQGKAEHIEGFQNYWKRTDKPKIVDFSDVTGGLGIRELLALTKPSEFGGYPYYHRSKNGMRRDRSISLQINDGKISFTAASEYAGTGNGDYYCMFSPGRAFYTETD